MYISELFHLQTLSGLDFLAVFAFIQLLLALLLLAPFLLSSANVNGIVGVGC